MVNVLESHFPQATVRRGTLLSGDGNTLFLVDNGLGIRNQGSGNRDQRTGIRVQGSGTRDKKIVNSEL